MALLALHSDIKMTEPVTEPIKLHISFTLVETGSVSDRCVLTLVLSGAVFLTQLFVPIFPATRKAG